MSVKTEQVFSVFLIVSIMSGVVAGIALTDLRLTPTSHAMTTAPAEAGDKPAMSVPNTNSVSFKTAPLLPGRSDVRTLLQVNLDAEGTAEATCRLSTAQRRRYLNAATREWLLNSAVLEEIENDLQLVVNCSRPGDVLLLDTSKTIRPPSRTVIPWPLTIHGYVPGGEQDNVEISASEKRTILTCPQMNEGLFSLRTTNVTLTDLVVKGCLFEVSSVLKTIIGIEACNSEHTIGTIRLQRIGFRENRFFGEALTIQANASSCSKLEIEDLDFQMNTCNGVCGLLLSKENSLQNVIIENNKPISSSSSRSAIIWIPPQSSTSADGIKAFENSFPTFNVEGGSFNLSNGNFTKNSATAAEDDSISACIKMKDTSAVIRNCSFEKNEASHGVAINAQGSHITLEDCAFRGNVAEMDGTISLRNRSSLTIDSCRFLWNRAEKSGGAIYAENTELNVTHLTCVQNKATLKGGCLHVYGFSSVKMTDSVLKGNGARSGGALYFRNASVVIDSSIFLSNRADKHGGGIRSVASNITVNELTADGNRAEIGGGGSISITSESNLTVSDSVFKNGFGYSGGAVEQSENSVGRFFNVTFVNNLAHEAGGSISTNSSTLIIHHSRFRDGAGPKSYLPYEGGFLCAVGKSSVFVKHATMINGSAGSGAAINVEKSTFEARHFNISSCTTDSEGGAITLEDSIFKAKDLNVSNCTAGSGGGAVNARYSEFLCTGCLFASNAATVSSSGTIGGGAISVTRYRRRTSVTQLQECRILNNTAESGGGLFLYESYGRNCWKKKYGCIAVTIIDTQFENNSAIFGGGAIFANRLKAIRFQCNSSSRNDKLTFLEEKDWSSLRRITSDKTVCTAWRNNSADTYGQVVATEATMAKMTVEYKGEKTEVSSGKGFEVRDYVGGNQLPRVTVEFLDKLKQGPARMGIGDILATLSTSEGFQVGNISLPVNGQTAKFPHMIGFGLPGIYNINIRFVDIYTFSNQYDEREVVDSLNITVHVRNCTIGEVPVGETKICSNCSTSAYNFDPEGEECQPCPENGNCTTRVIIPNDGYWHASPCSVNITRCLTSYACKFDDRVETLTNLTRDMKSCSINATTVEEYRQEQCAEGHTGPLCGACNTSYGSSVSSRCEECPTTFGNVLTICSAAVILLVLSSVTIRGTLSTASSRLAMLSGHRRIPRSIPLEDLSLPAEAETSEIQASQEDSLAIQDTNDTQVGLIVNEVTLGQWKAVEIFKIMLNYIQMTVLIASLDVGWAVPILVMAKIAEFFGGLAVDSIRRSVVCLDREDQSLHPTVWASIVSVCLVPASVFLLLVVFWMAVALFHRIRRPIRYVMQRSLLSLMALWYVTSVPVIKTTLSTVLCADAYNTLDATGENDAEIVDAVEGEMISYWAVDTSLRCFEGDHLMLVILIASFVFLVYGGLLIAFVVILGSSEEQLDDTDSWIYQSTGFLYRSYRHGHRRYWEVAIVARKAGIAFLVFCSHRFDSSLPISGAAVFLTLAVSAQIVAMPYRQSFDELNRIDIFSLFVSLLTTLLATMLKNESLTVDAGRLAISVLCVLLNITALIVLVSFLFCYFVDYVKLSLKETGTIVDPSTRTLHVLRVWLHFKIRSVADFVGFSNSDDLSSISSGI